VSAPVRKLTTVLLLAALALSGCGLVHHDSQDDKLKRAIEEKASLTVFLRPTATDRQHQAVEAKLRSLPGVKDVVYESKTEAYATFSHLFSAEPGFVGSVRSDSLPDSYRVRLTGTKAARQIRDSPLQDEIENLPGVDKILFSCLTVDECRKVYSPKPTPSPSPS
jgi:cell division transport system permease protein